MKKELLKKKHEKKQRKRGVKFSKEETNFLAHVMVDPDIYYEQIERRLNPPRTGLEKAADKAKYRMWYKKELLLCQEIAKDLSKTG